MILANKGLFQVELIGGIFLNVQELYPLFRAVVARQGLMGLAQVCQQP